MHPIAASLPLVLAAGAAATPAPPAVARATTPPSAAATVPAKPDLADARATELDRIQITATRRPESTLDVPVASNVLGRRALRELAPQTVMDALHGEPGTFVQQTTPGQAIVIVRGLKGSEVLHLVDGFRLNHAIFRNAPNQYVALVDAQMLERIEVVRGPMSTLYGGDAMGGVIQMLSWRPRFRGPGVGQAGAVRTIWSSADQALLARTEAAVGGERFSVSGGLTYQDVGELRVGGGTRLPFTAYTARGGDLRAAWRPADGHELTLSLQSLEQPKTPRVDELLPGFGQTRPNASTFLFEPQARRFAALGWQSRPGSLRLEQIELLLGRQQIDDDRRTRDFGSPNEERERNAVVTDGLSWKGDISLGPARYLSFGVEHYRDKVMSSRTQRNLASGALSRRPSRFPDRSTMRQSGLFATHDWRATERLDLVAGLRASWVRVVLPPRAGALGVRIDDDDFSGNLGLNLALRTPAPDADLRLVANLGRGFRAPNVFDLGTLGARPGNRFNVPNPALKPERVTTLDAGLKFAAGWAEGEVIGFVSRYRDKITAVPTGETTPAGQLVVQSRNAARLALRGIEAGIVKPLGATATLRASATWTRGEETLAGIEDPADRIPPLFGRVGVRWSPRADVELEGYAFYAARQDRLSPRDRADPRIDPNGTAGWTSWNARVAWRPYRAVSLALRFENLADKRYREHGSGLDEPGRNAIATVEWRW